MKKLLILAFICTIFITGCGTKRLDNAGEIMKKVYQKYDQATSVQVNFENSSIFETNQVHFKGQIIFKAPDKYYSQIAVKSDTKNKEQIKLQGTVTSISDGKTLWQLSQQEKRPTNIFKKVLTGNTVQDNVYTIIFKDAELKNSSFNLTKTKKQNNKFYYILESRQDTINTILWINGDQWTIDQTETYTNNSQTPTSKSIYRNYIFNKNIPDSKFNYTPPKGAKVDQEFKS